MRLFDWSDQIYIGSTCQELEDRLQNHVADKKKVQYISTDNTNPR